MARSLAECSSSFFRYHYTKGADAAAAASLSATLREATKRRPFASSIPPRAEWSQNNLLFIGETYEAIRILGTVFFPPSLPLPPSPLLRSVLRGFSLSFARLTIIFTAWHLRANNTYPLVCTRARTTRCTESRNLIETCRYSQPSRT